MAERLQIDLEITLDKAISIARQGEMLKKQQPTVRIQQHEAVSVENVNAKKRPHTKRSSNPVPRPPWVVDLTLNGHPVQFKIDTGADVTVIGETDYKEARDGPLQSSKPTLSGPSQTPLEVLGKFQANLRHNDRETQDDVLVIKGLQQPLVGDLQ